jgi:hypothetical protein
VSALSHGGSAGAALGVVAVILGQQLGYFPLSSLGGALEYVILGAVFGGVAFGFLGWVLGRYYPPPVSPK